MRFISARHPKVGVAYVFTHNYTHAHSYWGYWWVWLCRIAHAYHALQHVLQLYFTMADKEDLHESAADLSFDEWVMRNGGSSSFISVLAKLSVHSSSLPDVRRINDARSSRKRSRLDAMLLVALLTQQ